MRIIIDLLAAYAIYMIGTALLVIRQAKKDRLPGVVIAWIAPFLSVVSFAIATARIFSKRPLLASPCPNGLESAEEIVAERRQQMFGGPRTHPQMAARWTKYYAFALEYEAAKVKKLTNKIWDLSFGWRTAA
jgi:hypothetical protein